MALVFGLLSPAARAVIFYPTADPTYNTTPPTGSLANSGWQLVGLWEACQGTPIAPNYFITARHIGGAVGDPIVLNGVTYTTTAFFDDAATDLRICQIAGTFPSWASLYRGSREVGQSLVVFGRGDSRGSAVTVGGKLGGWMWDGTGRGTLRWGQNTIVAAADGGSYWGKLLYALFTGGGGANEAHLAGGDSSGPVFINDGTGWTLAGIAASVDGQFNMTNSGSGFDAALFDARGLYYGAPGNWQLISASSPVPSGFYATQISVRLAWIDSIITPPDSAPLLDGPLRAVFALLLGGIGVVFLSMRAPAAAGR